MRILVLMFTLFITAFAAWHGSPALAEPARQERIMTEEELRELDKTTKYIERKNHERDYTVPHYWLKSAVKEFAKDPLGSFNDLRNLALDLPPDAVRLNLKYAEKQDLDADLLELFRRVVAWAEDLRAKDGAAVWRQAEIEEKRGLHRTDKYVVLSLRWLARDKKYPTALHQHGLELLAKAGDDPSPIGAIARFEEAAHQNYEPSIRKLIDFLVKAKHFREHRGAAYYWFRRGELRGYDMSRWRPWMADNVTSQDRAWAEKYLKAKTYPPGWEYE